MATNIFVSEATSRVLVAVDNLKTRAMEYLAEPKTPLRFEVCAAMALFNNAVDSTLDEQPILLDELRQSLSHKFDAFTVAPSPLTLATMTSTAVTIAHRIHNAL